MQKFKSLFMTAYPKKFFIPFLNYISMIQNMFLYAKLTYKNFLSVYMNLLCISHIESMLKLISYGIKYIQKF